MIRVHIADDSPIIRSSLARALGEFSDTTIVSGASANGARAMEWLGRYYADLLITDVRMPLMDGLELIHAVKKHYPWMSSFVVSSYDDFSYAKASIQLEAVDYLLKPIDPELLERALTAAIDKIYGERQKKAAQLLLRQLPLNRDMLDRWVQHIQLQRVETMPILIVDTLDMLGSWVGDSYYLLNSLSNLWLETVIHELQKNQVTIKLDEGRDLGLGDSLLERSRIRSYFRLCTVRRLEEGSHVLLKEMNHIRDPLTIRMVDMIHTYVEAHYKDKISLQELADQVEMSKNYMCTKFKEDTGMTIHNYVIDVRMRKARELLLATTLKSYEIAHRVGYDNVIYFSQSFKKTYGLSPMDYKKRMEQ
ncbi:response regulator [Paenibacillus sp. HB172176]|uniref:response regulator transcription factor n=1 Tax=Paenibacillus sp. HB172176 TaxID=2493690 RepID=UPI00143AC87D|nr:response regulator [Paenibacillus sp. HB172176]